MILKSMILFFAALALIAGGFLGFIPKFWLKPRRCTSTAFRRPPAQAESRLQLKGAVLPQPEMILSWTVTLKHLHSICPQATVKV